jgi:hypothetical protein
MTCLRAALCFILSMTGLSVVLAPVKAPADTLSVNCDAPARLKATSSDQMNASTDSATFVNIPETTVTFNQAEEGCVLVHFTLGATANSLSDGLRVRPRIVGVASYPNEVTLLSYNGATATFVLRKVPAGVQTLNMQFRSDTASDVFVSRTVVTVLYQ